MLNTAFNEYVALFFASDSVVCSFGPGCVMRQRRHKRAETLPMRCRFRLLFPGSVAWTRGQDAGCSNGVSQLPVKFQKSSAPSGAKIKRSNFFFRRERVNVKVCTPKKLGLRFSFPFFFGLQNTINPGGFEIRPSGQQGPSGQLVLGTSHVSLLGDASVTDMSVFLRCDPCWRSGERWRYTSTTMTSGHNKVPFIVRYPRSEHEQAGSCQLFFSSFTGVSWVPVSTLLDWWHIGYFLHCQFRLHGALRACLVFLLWYSCAFIPALGDHPEPLRVCAQATVVWYSLIRCSRALRGLHHLSGKDRWGYPFAPSSLCGGFFKVDRMMFMGQITPHTLCKLVKLDGHPDTVPFSLGSLFALEQDANAESRWLRMFLEDHAA